jgi:GTP-binding protein
MSDRNTTIGHRPVVAIIGRPNVGKSRLFNRLVGKRVAIVEDIPGVTRDRNYADCAHEGRSFTLVDTGGLDPTATAGMTAKIRTQTEHAVGEADALILVLDGREGVTALDEEIVARLRRVRKPVVYAVNKIDTPSAEPSMADFYRLGVKPLIPISAEQGVGVDDLMETVLSAVPKSPDEEAAEETDSKGLIHVAVVGRPNVGKSTLINTLLGEDRLITDDTPGTTRDSIDTLVRRNDRSYLLIDTAGIRRRGRIERGVERYSIGRAQRSIERCDVAVLLLDGEEGPVEQDTKIAGLILKAGRGCLLAVNKCDIHTGDAEARRRIGVELQRRFVFLPWAEVAYLSALKGEGVEGLFDRIQSIYRSYTRRVTTGELNRWFEATISQHPPPSVKGRRTKLLYITQVKDRPPVFVIFANRTEILPPAYLRYLENNLRGTFDFTGVPIRLQVRGKPK